MNAIQNVMNDPLAQAVGWALVHFLWQGAIVAGLLALALAVVRHPSTNVRYGLAGLALLVMAGLPVGTIAVLAQDGRGRAVDERIANGYLPRAAGGADERIVATPQTVRDVIGETSARGKAGRLEGKWWRDCALWLEGHLSWLVLAWLIGVAALSLRLLGGWLRVSAMVRRQVEPVAGEWVACMDELARRMRVSRPVRLLQSTLAVAPMTMGWLRPVILMPTETLGRLLPEQVKALLAHELAHIRRHDYLVNLVQMLIETLLFYHPAVWWVSRVMRNEREACCDQLAAKACEGRLVLARALASMEEMRAVPRFAMGARGGILMSRIQRLVGKGETHSPRAGWAVGPLALFFLVTITIGIVINAMHLREASAAQIKSNTPASVPASLMTSPTKIEQDLYTNTFKGPFVLNETMPIVGSKRDIGGIELRFEHQQQPMQPEKLLAKVWLTTSLWPGMCWQARIRLFDKTGKVLGGSIREVDWQGIILGRPLVGQRLFDVEFPLSFLKQNPQSFELTVIPIWTEQPIHGGIATGAFRTNEEIPLELKLIAPEITLQWIQFEEEESKSPHASLQCTVLSWPQAEWRVVVKLMDAKNEVLDAAEERFKNSGVILGDPILSPLRLSVVFDKIKDFTNVSTASVRLERVFDGKPRKGPMSQRMGQEKEHPVDVPVVQASSAAAPSTSSQDDTRTRYGKFCAGDLNVAFNWNDIPTLLELANDTTILRNTTELYVHIPGTFGSYIQQSCVRGMTALYLIEGICQHEIATQTFKDPEFLFCLPDNTFCVRDPEGLSTDSETSVENHRIALRAYRQWWQENNNLLPLEAALKNPLEGTSLRWWGARGYR